MASGHRKRKAALLRSEVLTPAGLTNVSEADRGNTTNQVNLINIGLYSSGGFSPTFTNGSTTLLSDSVSNADGAWTAAGLTGETTNVGAFVENAQLTASGFVSGGKHFYFPQVGTAQTVYSGSTGVTTPVIIYTNEGPQSKYVPYYLGDTAKTGSIRFGTEISGAGTTKINLYAYVGGQLSSGDVIRFLSPSDGSLMVMSGVYPVLPSNSVATASATDLSNNSGKKVMKFALSTDIVGEGGLVVEFSSSAKTSTTPVAGAWVILTTGST